MKNSVNKKTDREDGHDIRRNNANSLYAKGIKVNRIAEMLGVDRSTVSRYLKEQRKEFITELKNKEGIFSPEAYWNKRTEEINSLKVELWSITNESKHDRVSAAQKIIDLMAYEDKVYERLGVIKQTPLQGVDDVTDVMKIIHIHKRDDDDPDNDDSTS